MNYFTTGEVHALPILGQRSSIVGLAAQGMGAGKQCRRAAFFARC